MFQLLEAVVVYIILALYSCSQTVVVYMYMRIPLPWILMVNIELILRWVIKQTIKVTSYFIVRSILSSILYNSACLNVFYLMLLNLVDLNRASVVSQIKSLCTSSACMGCHTELGSIIDLIIE